MGFLVQDIRLAFRVLLANRGFAAATLLTVALGVGGTAAVFSVVHGVLLRPLPYDESGRLVRLWEVHPGANAPFGEPVLSAPTYRAWSRSSESLEAIGSYTTDEFDVTGAGAARRVRGVQVTPSLFRVLRATPVAGRLFDDADAERGAAPVVVLAHATWQERFGGDPNVIDRRLTLDGVDYRIVGVLPPRFSFPRPVAGAAGRNEVGLYMPFRVAEADPEARVVGVVRAIARLADAATGLPGIATRDGEPLVATALQSVITPGFAEALNMRLVAGRFLAIEDTTSPIIAMLVNEAFVNAYFDDGRPAVGRRFSGMFAGMLGRDDAVVEVVGVVEDVLLRSPDQAPQPQIHVPYGVGFGMRHATLVLRTDGSPATSAPLLAGIVQQLDPFATLGQTGPLTDRVATAVERPRFAAFVVGAFAALALSLAIAGLYGVLSFGVNQRRREIGVRAALGATPGDLVSMVLKQGMTVTAIGLSIGLGGSLVASRAVAGVLFGVEALDGVAFIIPSTVVLAVAAAACYLPGRRAAAIAPAEALVSEQVVMRCAEGVRRMRC